MLKDFEDLGPWLESQHRWFERAERNRKWRERFYTALPFVVLFGLLFWVWWTA